MPTKPKSKLKKKTVPKSKPVAKPKTNVAAKSKAKTAIVKPAKAKAKPKAKSKLKAKVFDCVVVQRGNFAFAHNNNLHKNHNVSYRIDSNQGPFPQNHGPVFVAAGGETQLGILNAGGGQGFRYTITGET